MNRRTFAAAALIAAAAMAGKNASHAEAGNGHHNDVAANASEYGTLDCRQLEALWESAGGSSGAAFTAAEIAMAESSGEQYSTDYDADGSVDRGYWQINSTHGSLSTFDAYGNARAAVQISGNGTDWTPWVTYNSGAYQGKC